MNGIAKFEKVSFEQFKKDWQGFSRERDFSSEEILSIYNKIILPRRATRQSAGYDFFAPISLDIGINNGINLPTGIKCKMDAGWTLQIYPRSGLGFKCGIHLANTVGIIDGDYYGNIGNEGHIFVKLVNDSLLARNIHIEEGEALCQGVFVPFGVAEGENEEFIMRTGGFGSTSVR